MAQRGDNFGRTSDFNAPERQKSLTPAGETYTGRVLFYWETMLGIQPPTAQWGGLKISGFGFPQDAPKAGTQTASLFALIKQIEVDLAAIRVQNDALIQGQAAALLAQQNILAQQTAALLVQQNILAQQTAALLVQQNILAQQTAANGQIIALLTSIDSKV